MIQWYHFTSLGLFVQAPAFIACAGASSQEDTDSRPLPTTDSSEEIGDETDDGSDTDKDPSPPLEWQWVFEDFEADFLQGEIERYPWRTEGGAYLDIVKDAEATYSGGENEGVLSVSATSGDVSMLKMSGVAGGALSKATLEFSLNVRELADEGEMECSIAAFRDASGESIGFVRIIRRDASGYDLAIRRNAETSEASIPLSTAEWYKVIFSYDAAAEDPLSLQVTDAALETRGSVFAETPPSTVETIQLGKVDYEMMSGTMLVDDVSIWVPRVSDLWVSADGDDKASGLSEDACLKTIQRASDKAGPGTVIHVAPGSYNERAVFHYAGLNPAAEELLVVGEGAPSEETVVDGSGIEINWGGLLEVTGTAHAALQNLSIKNSQGFGVFVYQSEYVRVDGIKTDSTDMSSVYIGESSHIEISHVEATSACLLDSNEIAAQENISLLSVSDFIVRDCFVHGGASNDNGGEGICVKGYSDNGRIYGNTVTDLPDDVGIYIGVGGPEESKSTHHISVYGNDVSADVGIAVSSEYGGTVEDVDIFNNIVHDSAFGGILVTKWQNDPAAVGAIGMRKRIRIFNNTVVGVGGGGVGGGIHLQCDDPDHLEKIEVFNNIASDNFSFQVEVPDAVLNVVSLSNNLIHGDGGIPYDSESCRNCVGGDPLFQGQGDNPFDLKPGSPAVDRGCDAFLDLDFDGRQEALTTDFLGRGRPQDASQDALGSESARYDIGAYEL